jgi:hypothetical protein
MKAVNMTATSWIPATGRSARARRPSTRAWVGVGALAIAVALAPPALAAPKYYFRVGEVKAGPEVDEALKAYAGEALKADLAARPEWASDIGATDTAELVEKLKARNLRGFSVVVRFEQVKKDIEEPAPGARRKRLKLDVKLSVFGTTIPEEKLAFSGDGESGVESEVPDKGMDAEAQSLAKDAVKDAIKQAVDQAVMKLSLGKSAPMNESKHGKKKKGS